MLTVLAVVASTVSAPAAVSQPVTPQCEYQRYMTAGVWSALDDAERAHASLYVRNQLVTTLYEAVRREREACK